MTLVTRPAREAWVEEFLRKHLTPEQLDQYNETGTISIPSRMVSEWTYIIREGASHVQVYAGSTLVDEVNAYSTEDVPPAIQAIGRKLFLGADEAKFLRMACSTKMKAAWKLIRDRYNLSP